MTLAFTTVPTTTTITTTTRVTRRSLPLYVSTALEEPSSSTTPPSENNNNNGNFPQLGEDGIYRINNKEEHQAFLQANTDKLIVLKIFAPWCRACKGLEPKFVQIANDDEEQYKDLPLAFAQLSIQHNKDFVKSLGVLALPTVQFYVGGALHDNFPCGPRKVPILKKKLALLVKDHVDAETRTVKETSIRFYQNQIAHHHHHHDTDTDTDTAATSTASAPGVVNTTEAVGAVSSAITETAQPPSPTAKERAKIRATIPYFSEMSLADADAVLDTARLLTFEPKSIIMREGKPGRTFYVIQSGEVEICQASTAYYPYDPLVVPASYLGTVINRLGPGDYFGERALMTGEPRAASIRASTDRVTCWAVDRDNFPHSSPLSGRTRGTQSSVDQLDNVNDKYGVWNEQDETTFAEQALRNAQTASQIRGSVNKPGVIRGVDTDDDDDDDDDVDYYYDEEMGMDQAESMDVASIDGIKVAQQDAIFGVLRRFQLIRQVSQCLDYIVNTQAQWGTAGIRQRRAFLVQRLSPSQRADVRETFRLIDASGDGCISLLELQRVMKSIGDDKTDQELLTVMKTASLDGRPEMNLQDFEGLMAEAEFYNLFRDVFSTLDTQNSGFVKAGELDRVLQGVRDLIADDRKSLIDVEDADILIDYERFSRMLLGTALI